MEKGDLLAGRYEIEEYSGGNGVVELYAALDRQLSRPVTVQALMPGAAKDKALLGRFEEHQRAGLTLFDCSVLAVYDLCLEGDRPYSVMERFNRLEPGALGAGGLDIGRSLRLAREAAAGVQCLRDLGLAGWRFTSNVVGLDDQGAARLAIIESETAGNGPSEDVRRLSLLLRDLLCGRSSARPADLAELSIPASITRLLEQALGERQPAIRSAGEFASAIEALEEASVEPTQAHLAGAAHPHRVASDQGQAIDTSTPAGRPTLTLATATAMPVMARQEAAASPPAPRPARPSGRAALPVLLLAALGIFAILLTTGLASPGRSGNTSTASSGPQQIPSAVSQAPDLRGLTLDEAKQAVSSLGLNLAVGEPVPDDAVPAERVARQEPGPGSTVEIGSVLTVNLSAVPLAPEAQPETQPAPPATGGGQIESKPQNGAAPGNSNGKNQPKEKVKPKDDD